jgi:hypothetical protein
MFFFILCWFAQRRIQELPAFGQLMERGVQLQHLLARQAGRRRGRRARGHSGLSGPLGPFGSLVTALLFRLGQSADSSDASSGGW